MRLLPLLTENFFIHLFNQSSSACFWSDTKPSVLDGNKRIGAHAMLVFLALNGIELEYTQQELIDLILSVAASKADAEALLQWIIAHQI